MTEDGLVGCNSLEGSDRMVLRGTRGANSYTSYIYIAPIQWRSPLPMFIKPFIVCVSCPKN